MVLKCVGHLLPHCSSTDLLRLQVALHVDWPKGDVDVVELLQEDRPSWFLPTLRGLLLDTHVQYIADIRHALLEVTGDSGLVDSRRIEAVILEVDPLRDTELTSHQVAASCQVLSSQGFDTNTSITVDEFCRHFAALLPHRVTPRDQVHLLRRAKGIIPQKEVAARALAIAADAVYLGPSEIFKATAATKMNRALGNIKGLRAVMGRSRA